MSKDDFIEKMEMEGVKTKDYISQRDEPMDLFCRTCSADLYEPSIRSALLECGHFICIDCGECQIVKYCGVKGCMRLKVIKISPYNTLLEYLKVVKYPSIINDPQFQISFINISNYCISSGVIIPGNTTFQEVFKQNDYFFSSCPQKRQKSNILIERCSCRYSQVKKLTIKQFFDQKKLRIRSNPHKCSIMIHPVICG